MPGASYQGAPPALTTEEVEIRENLRCHVQMLAGGIGERNHARPLAYHRAAQYIAQTFTEAGYCPNLLQARRVGDVVVHNLQAELPGATRPEEVLVVGAHYDSEEDCPGANDNGSGIAALLEIARACASHRPARTLRFVGFYDEENFGQRPMGSDAYADYCRRRNDNIIGMISLETMGYYSETRGSQHYPFPFSFFYPKTGNFIAFVGNSASGPFVRRTIASFRAHTQFPSEGLAAPWFVPDAGRSDHGAFWRKGYPGLMVTDTAEFRYAYYHDPEDTPEKLVYARFAQVTAGLVRVILDLADAPPPKPPAR